MRSGFRLAYGDELARRAVARELLARSQLQIGPRVFGSQPVGEPHRGHAERSGAVAAVHVQTLETEYRGASIAAAQLPLATELGTRSELSRAGEARVLLRMDGEGAGAVPMSLGLSHLQLARE